jgi:hypothetical protein
MMPESANPAQQPQTIIEIPPPRHFDFVARWIKVSNTVVTEI